MVLTYSNNKMVYISLLIITYWNALSKQCHDCLENTDQRAIHLSMTSVSQVLKLLFFFSGFSCSWIRWPYSNLNLIKHSIVVMQCKCQELFPIAEWWEAGIRSFTELTNTRNEDDCETCSTYCCCTKDTELIYMYVFTPFMLKPTMHMVI